MITFCSRNTVDIPKYNACVSTSIHTRIYAYSWYLDAVCDQWAVLILDNYQAVMPLPIRKKMGVHYIYQAPWIQQLGIFSNQKLDASAVKAFFKAIPKKFILIDTFLNTGHPVMPFLKERYNFILPLHSDFKTIKKQFSKNRKRKSKDNFDNFRIEKNGTISTFLDFYKKTQKHTNAHKDALEKLENLLQANLPKMHIWTVFKDQLLIAGLCWLKDKKRITYLVPIANQEAKKENIPTYLINQLIKDHQNTNLVLDFEGSMIAGVAQFYKSFGAKKEIYYHFRKYKLF